ncbi:hypothetical protein GCM10009733_043030 [Nonomuraea maheshkhaliensis]|uniref:Uncharacterized protein n=1 Tax=Nonomuraea maheshkhaliensis TaxID=419590 RepID=A0ABN2FDC7_9ACTN
MARVAVRAFAGHFPLDIVFGEELKEVVQDDFRVPVPRGVGGPVVAGDEIPAAHVVADREADQHRRLAGSVIMGL